MNKKELAGQLISAVVYIALGLILALNPGMSANLICSGIGVCALVYGAFSILLYYMRRRDGDVSRFALPVGIALGAFCLIAPEVVLSIIPLLFGVVLLIDGSGKLGRAFELRRAGFPGWSTVLVVALLVMLFGVLLVTQPYMAVEPVMRLFGALLTADGAIELSFILRIYRNVG